MGTSTIQRQQLREALDQLTDTISYLKNMLDGLEALEQGNGNGNFGYTTKPDRHTNSESHPNGNNAVRADVVENDFMK